MKPPVDYVFPPIAPGQPVPYWRLVLRGCSQLCFQTNELTGLFFLAAVLVASPVSAAYMLVAATIAPGGRMLLGERGPVLATGLPGLNPSLIAVSLPAFFHTGWTNLGMWAVLLICVVCAVVMVRLFVAILPFPILVLPFLIIFWVLYAVAPYFDVLQPIVFGASEPSAFNPFKAVVLSLGQAMFSPTILSGLLFITGVLLSNWRHAVVAFLGAVIGTMVSYYYRDVDPASVNLGLYGFNGVLAAVSVFVMCGGKLRLAALGALLATILMPAIGGLGVQIVSAPFVITTWLMLALGWVEDNWFGVPQSTASSDDPAPTISAKSS
jgi:urea transporter